MTNTRAEPIPAGAATRPRSRLVSTLTLTAAALLVVLGFAAAAPAGWQSVTHFDEIGSDGRFAGTVRVAHCDRGAWLLDWSCTGRYAVNDREAQPYPPIASVTIANAARRWSPGSQVDVVARPGSHEAYLWGNLQRARVVVLWVGTLLSVLAVALAIRSRRRRSRWPALICLGAAGCSFLLAHPLW